MHDDDREHRRYVTITSDWCEADILAAITRDDPEELRLIPISVSMYPYGRIFSQTVCLRLAAHPNPIVRGNAILGFGHLARLFRYLKPNVKAFIESALNDESNYVRGQADAAADDVEWFLGWVLHGREDRRLKPVCRPNRDDR